VGVKRVFAWAGFLEGAEESAVIFAKGRSGNVAGVNGRFDMGIIGRIADIDGEVACMNFHVLAGVDVFDGDVAGGTRA